MARKACGPCSPQTARGEALSRQVDELKQEQSKSRQHFSAELEKGRAAIDEAAQRSTEAEHRALREIDRERTARAQAEKQLGVASENGKNRTLRPGERT